MAAMQTGASQRLVSTPSVSLTSLTATLLSSYFLTFRFLRQRSLRRSWNWKKKTEPLRNLPTWTKNLKKHCSKNFAWQWQHTLLKTFRSFPYRTVKMVFKKLNSTTVSQRKRNRYSDNQAQVYYYNSELVRDCAVQNDSALSESGKNSSNWWHTKNYFEEEEKTL